MQLLDPQQPAPDAGPELRFREVAQQELCFENSSEIPVGTVEAILGRASNQAVVAYLRVSTGSQDLATQKLAILDFAQKRRFTVDEFIESKISSRKSPLERRIDEMCWEGFRWAIACWSASCRGSAVASVRCCRSLPR